MEFEIEDFETWFKKEGYDEDYKESFRLGWNAGVKASCERVGMNEGTDFGIEKELVV